MKAKTTRRALLTSVLSLVLCVSMLIGSTYAWFTDSVTSGRNMIQSGNLDVVLEYWDGDSYEEVTSETKLFDDGALWEPGYTEVAYLKVSNAGSLALKYQLAVNVYGETVGKTKSGEDITLSDHLVFSVVEKELTSAADEYTRETARAAAGTATGLKSYNSGTLALQPKTAENAADREDYVALIVYMPETVGNEANHNGTDVPSIEMGVNLVATQFTYEDDSFDNQYDKNAWGEGFGVYSAQDLQAAVNSGETYIVVQENIELSEMIVVPAAAATTYSLRSGAIAIDLNGKTITAADPTTMYAFNNLGNLVLMDSVGGGSVNARGIYNGYDADGNYVTTATLTVENGTYNAKGTDGGAAIFNYGIAEINGGTFTSVGGYSLNNRSGATMTVNQAVVTGGIYNNGTLTVIDGSIKTDRGGYTHAIYSSGGSLTVENGTFSGNGNEVINSNSDVAIINGGTFTKIEKTSYLMAGSKMVINGGIFNAHESNPAAHPVRPDVTVKGGTFNYEHTNIAEGSKIVDNGDGTWTVSVIPPVVVESATDLTAAVAEGGTVTVDATDIETTLAEIATANQYGGMDFVVYDGLTMTGLTLSVEGANQAFLTDGASAETGEIVFEDCTFEAASFNTTVYFQSGANASNTKLIFNNCKFYGCVQVADNKGAGVEFNGCTFNLNDDGFGYVQCMGGTNDFNGCTFNIAASDTTYNTQMTKYGCLNTFSMNYNTVVNLTDCNTIATNQYNYKGSATINVN